MDRTCCVTGNRPKGFCWDYYDKNSSNYLHYIKSMTENIVTLIEKNNCVHFVAGGAIGVDMDFAELVIKLRDSKYNNITLELAIPFLGHHDKFSWLDKKRFLFIKNKADKVAYINPNYTRFAYHTRNRYMIEKADIVTAFWNGVAEGGTYYTLTYAKKLSKEVTITPL